MKTSPKQAWRGLVDLVSGFMVLIHLDLVNKFVFLHTLSLSAILSFWIALLANSSRWLINTFMLQPHGVHQQWHHDSQFYFASHKLKGKAISHSTSYFFSTIVCYSLVNGDSACFLNMSFLNDWILIWDRSLYCTRTPSCTDVCKDHVAMSEQEGFLMVDSTF